MTGPARLRPAADRLTTDDVCAADRAHRAYHAATARPNVLAALGMLGRRVRWSFYLGRAESLAERMQSPLARLMEQAVALANAGASEAEVMAFELALAEVRHACYGGTARRSEAEVDRDNHQAEYREAHCRTERLTGNRTAAVYRLEAEAKRACAAVDLEGARIFDVIANRLETSRDAGRERVQSFTAIADAGGR